MKRISHAFIIFLYTYLIANSMLFATGIAASETLTPALIWKGFIYVFCQWWVLSAFFEQSWSFLVPILVLIVIAWDVAIFFFPLRLWLRQKTVFHAWLVAIAGAFIPQFIALYLRRPPSYLFYGFLLMNLGYAIAWLVERGSRPVQQLRQESSDRVQKEDDSA